MIGYYISHSVDYVKIYHHHHHEHDSDDDKNYHENDDDDDNNEHDNDDDYDENIDDDDYSLNNKLLVWILSWRSNSMVLWLSQYDVDHHHGNYAIDNNYSCTSIKVESEM